MNEMLVVEFYLWRYSVGKMPLEEKSSTERERKRDTKIEYVEVIGSRFDANPSKDI